MRKAILHLTAKVLKYLSDDPVELRRFTNTLTARARNTAKAAESARRALQAATTGEISGGDGQCQDPA